MVPAAVLVEVDYWLLKLYGHKPWRTFAEDVENGAYRLHPLSSHTLTGQSRSSSSTPRSDLGLVDASVIATCEELVKPEVATLDRRDFSVVRPRHREYLTLLPE